MKSPYEEPEEVIPYIDYLHPGDQQPAITTSSPLAQPQAAHPLLSTQLSTLPTSFQSTPINAQPELPRKSLSAGITALLVILVFLLIGGSLSSYYFFKVHPAELNTQATAVVKNILTAQAQATVQTHKQTLADLSSMTVDAIYKLATARNPVLNDPLTREDNNDWVNSTQQFLSCSFSGGAYQATIIFGFSLCLAEHTNFTNFAYQVHLRIVQGNGGGILFRADDQHYSFYLFTIDQLGNYSLQVLKDNAQNSVLTQGTSSAIKTGYKQDNILTVIAFDDLICLYINAQFIDKIHDSLVSAGKIGVSSYSGQKTSPSNPNPTAVLFSDAQVWSL